MQLRMSRRLRIVLYVTIGVFIVGLPAAFVPRLGGLGRKEPPHEEELAQVVAKVNGLEITRAEVEGQFNRVLSQTVPFYVSLGQRMGLSELWRYRLAALEEAVTQELLLQQATSEGLTVSKKEVRARAEELADRELARVRDAVSPEELEYVLANLLAQGGGPRRETVSERGYRDWLVERMLEEERPLQYELLMQKLRKTVVGGITATEQEVQAQYDTATVREIQVWLRPEGQPERSDEEARQRAEELTSRARRGGDFAGLVRRETDDPGGRENGGLIESVGRRMMAEEWTDAVFALGPDEISDPIKLPWGYAVVKMEKLRRELPDDFESNKDQLLLSMVQEKQNAAWQERRQALRDEAQVEVLGTELLAWQALEEGKSEEALTKLQAAAEEMTRRKGVASAVIFYQLASLLEVQEDREAAVEAYESSYDSIAGAEAGVPGAREEVVMGIARCYERLEDVEEALDWYQILSDMSEDPAEHIQLQGVYERLGKDELAAAERAWLDEYREAELARQREIEAQQRAEEEQGEGEESRTAQ